MGRQICRRRSRRRDVAKPEKALAEAIHDPGVSAKLKALAVNPSNATPAEYKHIIETDIVKIKGVVKAANLKFED